MKRFLILVATALIGAGPVHAQVAPAGDAPDSPQEQSTPFDASPEPLRGARPLLRGYVGLEGRTFTQSPAAAGQIRQGVSLVAQPELSYQSANRRHRINATLFGRVFVEPGYLTADVRELNWQYQGDRFSLLAGMNRVFWGATESRHLVDIINQSDLRESFAGDVKLGQLMVVGAVQQPWGQVELYALPQFRERAFAPRRDRPRLWLPLADAEVADGAPLDWAARASISRGDVDVHAYYFRGVNREPDLIPVFDGPGPPMALKPVYLQIGQIGADVQVAQGAWLFKGEFINRSRPDGQYQAGVGGFEYGISRLFGSVSDVTLLAEYQFDNEPESEWPAPAARGVYGGIRLALNDNASSEIKAGTVYDVRSGSWLVKADFNRRLTDQWGLNLGYYGFSNVGRSPALRDYYRDSHLTITLRRYL
jgi:hypothetical protein